MTDTPDTMTGAEFAQVLAALRWKQVDFAARAGVTAEAVNRWVHGRQAVPAWAAGWVRLLLAADQFHRLHVAPLPRSRKPATDTTTEGDEA